MASRLDENQGAAPEPGQILIVIHDFSARSSDELSLSKGDRVELIERDDDFGDGWYLGRHLINGKSGLFPEVYTRIAPRGSFLYSPTSSAQPFTPMINSKFSTSKPHATHEDGNSLASNSVAATTGPRTNTSTRPQESKTSSNSTVTGLSEAKPQSKMITTTANSKSHRQDIPVMNETLSVIDEHITDLKSPRSNMTDKDRQEHHDSGSEYSSQAGPRLSYDNEEETDEEEGQNLLTREQVSGWTSEEVAEHLFIIGVEPKHCEILRDQEITGDVLLCMDQTTIFLKEFDFGSVGRRLKTWQKIKSFQDEVNDETPNRRDTANFKFELGEETGRNRSRSTNSSSTIPRNSNVDDKHFTSQNSRISHKNSLHGESFKETPSNLSKFSQDISYSDGDRTRHSTGVRDMQKYRQNSGNQTSTTSFGSAFTDNMPSTLNTSKKTHSKKGSFDRNWTMQSIDSSQSSSGRPTLTSSMSANRGPIIRNSVEIFPTSKESSSLDKLDCGYFSSAEAETGHRNFTRKRESTGIQISTHSRRSSYAEEQSLRVPSIQKTHTRFGSVDSIRDGPPQSAVVKYFGMGNNSSRRRTPSETSTSENSRSHIPKDESLTVSRVTTKLESELAKPSEIKQNKSDFLASVKSASNGRFGLRAISNAVTGHEKSRLMGHAPDLPSKISPIQSPPGTGSRTPSGGLSFDLESPGLKSANSHSTSNSSTVRVKKKSKKETSAYTRGLEKKKPQEAMLNADYSGWMKKKSTNLMAAWKPRLFILKGRRLSYYYSEDDDGEKGLIDISFHRVLPADNDRLTGLHATLTGATHNPTSLGGDNTIATAQMAESHSSQNKGNDSMFIFKLVPPKAGLQRAVTFTKPTVHYFAVPSIKQGRLWMAALMKATIERDESVLLKSTYQQKTISLTKARAMRHRPPALMNLNEQVETEAPKTSDSDEIELDISGIVYNTDPQEGDSGVSGVSNSDSHRRESIIEGSSYIDSEQLKDLNSQPNTA